MYKLYLVLTFVAFKSWCSNDQRLPIVYHSSYDARIVPVNSNATVAFKLAKYLGCTINQFHSVPESAPLALLKNFHSHHCIDQFNMDTGSM